MILFLCILAISFIIILLDKKYALTKKTFFKPKKKPYNIDDAYNENRKKREIEIDHLLSKIGKNGLDDLSVKERKRLDELSKK